MKCHSFKTMRAEEMLRDTFRSYMALFGRVISLKLLT